MVGPVYTYGSGTKRSGKKGHLRAPVYRLAGPINATPAQRRASLDGRACSQDELDEELQRLAPGPGFATSARSTAVIPRPCPSASTPHSEQPREPTVPSQHALPDGLSPNLDARIWSWGAFAEYACSEDVLVPSLRWGAAQPARVWAVPVEWHRCLRVFNQLSLNEPWSSATWRATAFLRNEAAPLSLEAKSTTFAAATQTRQLFIGGLSPSAGFFLASDVSTPYGSDFPWRLPGAPSSSACVRERLPSRPFRYLDLVPCWRCHGVCRPSSLSCGPPGLSTRVFFAWLLPTAMLELAPLGRPFGGSRRSCLRLSFSAFGFCFWPGLCGWVRPPAFALPFRASRPPC